MLSLVAAHYRLLHHVGLHARLPDAAFLPHTLSVLQRCCALRISARRNTVTAFTARWRVMCVCPCLPACLDRLRTRWTTLRCRAA